MKISHDIEIQTGLAFQLMPGGYFSSLKFLRQNWYDYETILATSWYDSLAPQFQTYETIKELAENMASDEEELMILNY